MKLENLLEEEYKNVHADTLTTAKNRKVNTTFQELFAEWYEHFVEDYTDDIDEYHVGYYKISRDAYTLAEYYIEEETFTPEDITDLCSIFNTVHKHTEDATKRSFPYIGCFLSACINTHFEEHFYTKKYVLITEELVVPLINIGMYNKAEITIVGSCNDLIGYKMKKGIITVLGNVKNFLGSRMKGGTIHISGNASQRTGYHMDGGEIKIDGNCGKRIGFEMNAKTFPILIQLTKEYPHDITHLRGHGKIIANEKKIYER